jgi:hypothetical protein
MTLCALAAAPAKAIAAPIATAEIKRMDDGRITWLPADSFLGLRALGIRLRVIPS